MKNTDLAKFILKRMAELGKFLCQVKEYYPLLYCHKVDFKPLCPFVHKVGICSPGMKQYCEKMQTKRIFSWRGWPSWVKFLYKVKKCCPLLCFPKVDFQPLSPFAHKMDICSPAMKQNCEIMQTKRNFSWRGWPSWVKNLYKVKKCCPLLCFPKVDFQPLSPFAHKMDICSPAMKQNCEKCWLS